MPKKHWKIRAVRVGPEAPVGVAGRKVFAFHKGGKVGEGGIVAGETSKAAKRDRVVQVLVASGVTKRERKGAANKTQTRDVSLASLVELPYAPKSVTIDQIQKALKHI